MATYAKLIHNGKIQTVALIEGLEAEEVTALLKTVFGISGNIVGIMAEVRVIYHEFAPAIFVDHRFIRIVTLS